MGDQTVGNLSKTGSTVICAAFHEDYHSAVSINGAMCHQPPANELVVAICITMIDL